MCLTSLCFGTSSDSTFMRSWRSTKEVTHANDHLPLTTHCNQLQHSALQVHAPKFEVHPAFVLQCTCCCSWSVHVLTSYSGH